MQRLSGMLAEAARLQKSGKLPEARLMLNALVDDPDAHMLGDKTSAGLPKRLHSVLLRQAKAEGDRMAKIALQFHLVPPPERLAPLARFTMSERLAIAKANAEIVPRIIHQIWIGPRPIPPAIDAWAEHARAQGYDHRLWRENDLKDVGICDDPVFRAMLARQDYPGAVDVARYRILWRDGGVYLDADWYPVRSDIGFHDLLTMQGPTVLAEETPRNTGQGGLLLANSFIATPPRHPVFQRLTEVMEPAYTLMPDADAWWTTGPLIFTLVARAGAVMLADGRFVVGEAHQRATLADVKRLCSASIARDDGGFLLAWKSW